MSHEGWQRKSAVERSGTAIEANDLTRIFRGACPKKTFGEISLKISLKKQNTVSF